MNGTLTVITVLMIAGLCWWRLSGARKAKRRMEYNAEQRRAKQAEEDAAWREKQDAKNNR